MPIRYLRTIILLFAVLTAIVGWFYDIKTNDINIVDIDYPLLLISFVCLTLFGLSFIGVLKRKPGVITFLFKISISIWFITITALNHFPVDYSYCLVLLVFMLSMVNASVKNFIIFYAVSFITLIISIVLIREPLIELSSFLLLFFASGILMFFILRSREKTMQELEEAQANAHAIFQSAVGFSFFLDKDFNIISFNKFAEEIFRSDMHMELKKGKSIFLYFPPETHESFRNTLGKCRDGQIINNEKKVNFAGGLSVWVENTFIPVYDDNKKFLGISFQTVRINERKEIEEALKESEERFLQLANNIEDAFWIFDGKKYIYLNDSFAKIFGREKDIFYNDPNSIFEFMHPDDRDRMKSVVNYENYKSRAKVDTQYRIVQPDHSVKWVWVRSFPIFDTNGETLKSVGILSDITDRKNAETLIKESEEKFRTLVKSVPLPLCYVGSNGVINFFNDRFLEVFGYNHQDIPTLNEWWILAYPNPEYREWVINHWETAVIKASERGTDIEPTEYSVTCKDGTVKQVNISGITVKDHYLATLIDVTEQKKAGEKVKQQNVFLQTLIDTIPNPVFYKDEKGRYIGCNKAFETSIGGMQETFIGKSVYDLSQKDLADIYFQKDNELFQNPGHQVYEAKVKFLDGTMHDVIFHKATFTRSDESIGGLVGVILDITERKRFEEALKESEEKFKEIADTLPLLVYETDEKGNIVYYNKAGYAFTGYNDEDFKNGLTLADMFPDDERERAMANAAKTMTGQTLGQFEYILKRKDGTLYTAIINTLPIIRNGLVVGRRGVVTDISEIKKAEEKIKASLKEKEILLSEIHHRVKNNLQVISSMLRLQSNSISDPKTFEVFLDAQHRIITMGLVHEKLYKAENFSKINVREYINDLVDSVASSYNPDPDKIKVVIDVDPVSINLDTMIPVGLILNELLTNSMKYAFPDGRFGMIHVMLKRQEDGKFKLCLADDGVGIPEFFDIEDSQSLGLRLVQTLSDQINGQLSINNQKGCTFSIEFSELIKKYEK